MHNVTLVPWVRCTGFIGQEVHKIRFIRVGFFSLPLFTVIMVVNSCQPPSDGCLVNHSFWGLERIPALATVCRAIEMKV